MVITIDKLAPEPLFEQVQQQIIAAIATGEVHPGDALPSVRSLAQDLGINLHTVHKAYEMLASQGYILLLGRRGAFVADAATDPAAGLDTSTLQAGLKRLATQFAASGGTSAEFVNQAHKISASIWQQKSASARKELSHE